jgi:hypothetical protein
MKQQGRGVIAAFTSAVPLRRTRFKQEAFFQHPSGTESARLRRDRRSSELGQGRGFTKFP